MNIFDEVIKEKIRIHNSLEELSPEKTIFHDQNSTPDQ
jgi:hypothetical protein